MLHLLDGCLVVKGRLMVMREVSRKEPHFGATGVQDLCSNEPIPLQGVQNAVCVGAVDQKGLAQVTVKLVCAKDPVIREMRMQLDLVVGLEEAIRCQFALGKGADLLKGNGIEVNSPI